MLVWYGTQCWLLLDFLFDHFRIVFCTTGIFVWSAIDSIAFSSEDRTSWAFWNSDWKFASYSGPFRRNLPQGCIRSYSACRWWGFRESYRFSPRLPIECGRLFSFSFFWVMFCAPPKITKNFMKSLWTFHLKTPPWVRPTTRSLPRIGHFRNSFICLRLSRASYFRNAI